LAKEVGVATNTLARWERGETSFPESADKLIRGLADKQTAASAVTWSQAVIRDPFHKSIIETLNRRLDPDVFEAGAVDLLRKDWPVLVPVSGGGDGEFDGAIARPDSEPFPLINYNNIQSC